MKAVYPFSISSLIFSIANLLFSGIFDLYSSGISYVHDAELSILNPGFSQCPPSMPKIHKPFFAASLQTSIAAFGDNFIEAFPFNSKKASPLSYNTVCSNNLLVIFISPLNSRIVHPTRICLITNLSNLTSTIIDNNIFTRRTIHCCWIIST